MSRYAVTGLSFGGAALMVLSLLQLRAILLLLRSSGLRQAWIALTGLVVVLVIAYTLHGWAEYGRPATPASLVVGVILFLGACFVAGVARLSRQTTLDVLRVSALEKEAITDPLTGLLNRRLLDARLDDEIMRARRFGFPLSVSLIDLDWFKAINDRHGHLAGDDVLREVAQLLTLKSRPGDTVVRYGGEEFLLIAPRTDLESGYAVADRIRRDIEAMRIHSAGVALPVTASLGVACLSPDDVGASALIDRADKALYRAKQEGRNRVCLSLPASAAAAEIQAPGVAGWGGVTAERRGGIYPASDRGALSPARTAIGSAFTAGDSGQIQRAS
jgi:diguanylate cyclase (GGDEF)-like protein